MLSMLPLALAVFAVGVDSYIVAAVLPAISDDLQEPIAQVGLLASAYALPTAVLAPVFGPISDRRGRRFALLLGLSIFAVAALGCILAPSLPVLLLARAINGVGGAIVLPAAFAAAGDLAAPEGRARAMGLLAGMFPLSTLLGLPFGALAAIITGWRGSFGFIFVVAIAAALLVLRLPALDRPPGTAGQEPGYLATIRVAIRDPRARAALSVTFLWLTATFGLFVYVAEFVHRTYGIPSNQAGLVYAVVGLVGVAATRFSDRVIARLGARRTVQVAIAAFAGAAFLLPATAVALPVTVLVFAVWAGGTWTGIPAMQTIVASLSSSARGTLLAFLSSAINLGAVVGPIVTGRVLEAGGFAWAAPWAAALGLVALIAAWRVLPDAGAPQAAAVSVAAEA
ncbi:MAG TPA: MFS transporter [Candidatus Limnocylindrales bacterium]|jgi:predicted MFS family arabinose efflux permease